MSKSIAGPAALLLASATLGIGCGGQPVDSGRCEASEAPASIAPDPDDDFDVNDPAADPDPIGDEEDAADAVEAASGEPADELATHPYVSETATPAADDSTSDVTAGALSSEDVSCRADGVKGKKKKGKGKKPKNGPSDPPPQCSPRPAELSPKGLTFVIHFSKHKGSVALKQLKAVKNLIRPRDIFFIEQKEEAAQDLRKAFPCNDIHFIAFPDEFGKALEAGDLVDGISLDWEGGKVSGNSAGWSANQLTAWANKIRGHGKTPSFVPYWPAGFSDGGITKNSKMGFELAQIQNRCAHAGAGAFADAASGLIHDFDKHGLTARDIGFEISLDSFADADNHTGVDASVACTRKAWGKGARAIYLYGNGQPHLDDYFKKIAKLGLRSE